MFSLLLFCQPIFPFAPLQSFIWRWIESVLFTSLGCIYVIIQHLPHNSYPRNNKDYILIIPCSYPPPRPPTYSIFYPTPSKKIIIIIFLKLQMKWNLLKLTLVYWLIESLTHWLTVSLPHCPTDSLTHRSVRIMLLFTIKINCLTTNKQKTFLVS